VRLPWVPLLHLPGQLIGALLRLHCPQAGQQFVVLDGGKFLAARRDVADEVAVAGDCFPVSSKSWRARYKSAG
jgi:hypothetical protein